MAGTIKMLTGRGDMYAQAAVARHDLQGEKLAVYHLREDVESYRFVLLISGDFLCVNRFYTIIPFLLCFI